MQGLRSIAKKHLPSLMCHADDISRDTLCRASRVTPRHARLAALLAVALVAGTLGACQPSTDKRQENTAGATAATTAGNAEPTATTVRREQKLAQFLRQRYGDKATLSGEWLGDLHDPENQQAQDAPRKLQQKVCAEQPVVIGAAIHELLAVCGELVDAGHPDPGFIDFFVLRNAGDTLEVSAEKLADTFGSSGRPGTVSVIRLGSDFYGFRVEDGWYGQGYSLESQNLVVPGPDGLVNAGTLRRHIDNGALYDCDEQDCTGKLFNVDFRLEADDSDRSARVWPLLVTEEGEQCGKPLSRQHRFVLDKKTWKYPFTESLQRESCD